MTYKTILLHLNDERRVGGLMDAAAYLATRLKRYRVCVVERIAHYVEVAAVDGDSAIEQADLLWNDDLAGHFEHDPLGPDGFTFEELGPCHTTPTPVETDEGTVQLLWAHAIAVA